MPKSISKENLAKLKAKIDHYTMLEQRERCRESLEYFVECAWPHFDSAPYQSNFAITAMAEHLEAVAFGHIPKLLINVPPRCSKTTIVSIIFPAWVWAQIPNPNMPLIGPQVKFLCASYSDKLTLDSSNKFRRLVQSEWYQKLFPLKFMKDQNTKGHMDNEKGGSRQSTSVGGTLLGLGGSILVGDDLNNTEKETKIETGAERETSANFWSEFHSTRKNDPRDGYSAVINVQQRVHTQDVSGVWLDSEEDVVHLCIPMRHDPKRHCITVKLPQYDDEEPWEDPRPYNSEDLMWPERFGEFEVHGLEKALGPYMAAGRLQQEPKPKGGGIIKREWWKDWNKDEAQKYGFEWQAGRREFPHFELVIGSLDTAYKEKEENDFNAFTIWGIWLDRARNRRAMLMFAWQKRLPLNGKVISALPSELPIAFKKRQEENWGLVDWVADGCKRYKVKRLLIEDKSRGHDVANEIRRMNARENWGVQLLPVVGDKVSRTHSVVPLFTDDCIWAPDTKWADLTIANCLVAGTKIFTDQGIKVIENIQLGDNVLTHKGRFRPVLATMKNKSKGLCKIEGKGLDPLVITPEHPFYAIHFDAARKVLKEADWVLAKDMIARIYKTIERNGKIYNEAYPSPCHAVTLPKTIREQSLDKIDLRDWATLPSQHKYDFMENETHFRSSHGKVNSIKWEQVLDKRFGRFLGLFIAEGCARRGGISWSFNSKETDYIEEVASFVRDRVGTGVYYAGQAGSCTAVCTNMPLIESFFREFGNYSYDKKIPSWIWDAPDEFIDGLVHGWLDGDGSIWKGSKGETIGMTGVTTSLSLAWGMRLLLLRLGLKCTLATSEASANVALWDGRVYNMRETYSLSFLYKPKFDGAAKIVGDLAAHSVMKVSSYEKEQFVYNIEVAQDNSYCTTGGLVHNCEDFPKGAHDDLNDSVTQFLNWARDNELLVLCDEMSAAMEEAATFRHKEQSVAEQYGV